MVVDVIFEEPIILKRDYLAKFVKSLNSVLSSQDGYGFVAELISSEDQSELSPSLFKYYPLVSPMHGEASRLPGSKIQKKKSSKQPTK